jgi:hypothetical protein
MRSWKIGANRQQKISKFFDEIRAQPAALSAEPNTGQPKGLAIKSCAAPAAMFPFGAIDGCAKRFHALAVQPLAGDTNMAPWSMSELALVAAGLIGAGIVAYLAFRLFGF